MARKKKKILPATDAPATQAERDQYRTGDYTPRPKKHDDSETELDTADEDKLVGEKFRISVTEREIKCEQNSCKKPATLYVATLDTLDDDPDQEESFYPACPTHAHAKKFNKLHIARITSIQEGISRAMETMPSTTATDKLEPNWRANLSYTQRIISIHAQDEAEKERARRVEAAQTTETSEFVMTEEDFPSLQPSKKAKVAVNPIVEIPATYPTPLANIPPELVATPEQIYQRLAWRAETENPEIFPENPQQENTTTPEKTENLETVLKNPQKTTTPESPEKLKNPEIIISQSENPENPDLVIPEMELMKKPHKFQKLTEEQLNELKEQTAIMFGREMVYSVSSPEPSEDEVTIPENQEEVTQTEETEKESGEEEEMSGLEEKETKTAQTEVVVVEEDEEENIIRPSTLLQQQQSKQQTQQRTLEESIDIMKNMLNNYHEVSHDIVDDIAARIDAYEQVAIEEGIITPTATASTSKTPKTTMQYSKVVASNAEKGKGKAILDDKADSESEEDPESEIIARECKLSKPHTGLRTPPFSDQTNTLWWDLSTVTTDHKTIAKAIMKENEICGYSYRGHSEWLELGYNKDIHRDEALKKIVKINDRNTITPIAPRHILGNEIFIQLVNVPIRPEEVSRKMLTPVLGSFGKIKQLEPVKYKFSGLMTRRWNILLSIPWGTKLAMPSILEIDSQRILAFWEGSPPACSTCLQGGHWQSKCTPALRAEAMKKAYLKAPPAPLVPATPEKEPEPAKPTTPPTKPTSPESSESSPKNPPPPPPPSAPEPSKPKEKTLPPTQTGQGKGKSPLVMEALMKKHSGDIKAHAKAQGFGVPTIPTSSSSSSSSSAGEENFVPVVNPSTVKRARAAERKADEALEQINKDQAEASKTRVVKKSDGKRQTAKRELADPLTKSPRTRRPSKTARTTETVASQKPGKKRSQLEKDTYCYYGIKYLGYTAKHCEKIWNMDRQEWENHRQTIPSEDYNRMYDWRRTKRGQEMIFSPVDFEIQTLPPKKLNEPITKSSSNSSDEEKKKNKIMVRVKIVSPETKKMETIPYQVPIGRSVSNLKKQIAEQFKVKLEDFRVINRGKTVEKEIFGEQIKHRFTLNVLGNWEVPEKPEMPEPAFKTVFVQDYLGARATFQITPATTTEDLITLYAGRKNKIARQLIFLYKNHVLNPKATLASVGIIHNDTIMVSQELKYILSVRAVIDGETQVKKIRTINEMTLDVLKHDVIGVFGTSLAEFEFEKNGAILPSSEKVRRVLHDGDIVSLRFKGTTRWDINRVEQSAEKEAKEENHFKQFVTLRYDNGTEWVKASFDYEWSETTTFEQIRDFLRLKIADEKLQIKYNKKQYETQTMLKDAMQPNKRTGLELYVEAIQDNEYFGDISSSESNPDPADI